MKRTKKKPEHYVNNAEFLEAMKGYKKAVNKAKKEKKNKPPVTDYIGSCFLKIANHLSYRPNFINYTFRDDMISDGIENCLQYLDNFNPAKSNNPFAYFTQIIYYAFIRRIQKEKKQTHIKHRIIEKEEYRTYDTLPGDTNSYNIQGFDPMIMLPDTPVYKTKVKHKEDYPQGLDKFMKDDKE